MSSTGSTPALPVPVPLALVVDPDANSRKLHAWTLEPLAREIGEAGDWADALAHALPRPPQLVVTELRLARIDGYALCGLLRNDSPRTTRRSSSSPAPRCRLRSSAPDVRARTTRW